MFLSLAHTVVDQLMGVQRANLKYFNVLRYLDTLYWSCKKHQRIFKAIRSISTNAIYEVSCTLDDIINHVTGKLPDDFPADISDAIFESMKKAKQKYTTQ